MTVDLMVVIVVVLTKENYNLKMKRNTNGDETDRKPMILIKMETQINEDDGGDNEGILIVEMKMEMIK